MNRGRHKKEQPLRVSDLKVVRRRYDPDLDAYLVQGNVKGKHVVGWQPRRNGVLVGQQCFSRPAAARDFFNKAAEDDERDVSALRKDWQKQAVYAWENKFIMPRTKKISKKEAEALIRTVALDYRIPTPRLNWARTTLPSEYDDIDNVIDLGAHDSITLLHELAHAVYSDQVEDDLAADHSPGFVRIALELYNRYANIPLDYMIVSAHHRGLLGDLDEVQSVCDDRHDGKRKTIGKKNPAP